MSPCLLRQVKKDRLGPCGTSSKGRGGRTSSPRFGRMLISSHRRYRVLGQQVSLLDVSRFHSPPSPALAGPGAPLCSSGWEPPQAGVSRCSV